MSQIDKKRTEGAVVDDLVGAVLDPGPIAFQCPDTDFLLYL
jgi:hypothetical protein